MGVGFAVGGGDYKPFKPGNMPDNSPNSFGGGTGAGVAITPVAFMVVGNGQIRLIPVNPEANTYDKLLDFIPDAIDRVTETVKKFKNKGKEKGGEVATTNADNYESY